MNFIRRHYHINTITLWHHYTQDFVESYAILHAFKLAAAHGLKKNQSFLRFIHCCGSQTSTCCCPMGDIYCYYSGCYKCFVLFHFNTWDCAWICMDKNIIAHDLANLDKNNSYKVWKGRLSIIGIDLTLWPRGLIVDLIHGTFYAIIILSTFYPF